MLVQPATCLRPICINFHRKPSQAPLFEFLTSCAPMIAQQLNMPPVGRWLFSFCRELGKADCNELFTKFLPSSTFELNRATVTEMGATQSVAHVLHAQLARSPACEPFLIFIAHQLILKLSHTCCYPCGHPAAALATGPHAQAADLSHSGLSCNRLTVTVGEASKPH